MKKILLIIFFVVCYSLQALILEVGFNGQTYSTIQSAVTASVDGDTILVYPGTYYENIVLHKNITLASRYILTNDENDVINTIIDGNYIQSALYVYTCQNISIIGLTFQHGIGTVQYANAKIGGGVFIQNCQNFNFTANIIQFNQAGGAGGIAISHSSGLISKNIIRFNEANNYGGISINVYDMPDPSSAIIFDPINKNSIYSNAGQLANDIWLTGADTINVSLKLGSSLIKSNHWINGVLNSSYHPYLDNSIVINYSCEEQYFENIDHDLYVSSFGDDSNSGLSESSPLRNIYTAMSRIQCDSLNLHTIFVSEGIYTPRDGEELFPIAIKDGASLKGINGSFTMDSREIYTLISANNISNISIENLNAINIASRGWDINRCFVFSMCNNLILKNIKISSESESIKSLMIFTLNSKLRVNDLSISLPISRGRSISADLLSNSIFENVLINGGQHALFLQRDATEYEEGLPVIFSNVGIFNSISDEEPNWGNDYLGSVVNFLPHTYINPKKNFFINWTIANNKGIDGPFGINGEASVSILNSIFWNNKPNTLGFTAPQVPTDSLFVNFKNCLFFEDGDSTFVTVNSVIIQQENCLYGNPGFTENALNPFALSPFSQCIDAGTTDMPEDVILPQTDLAGNPRIYGENIDLGAYEYSPQSISIPDPVNYEPTIKCSVFPNPIILSSNRNLFCNFDVKFPKSTDVDISIYNIKGQKLLTLANGLRSPGESRFNWDGRDSQNNKISSGVYIYKIKTKDSELSGKFTVID